MLLKDTSLGFVISYLELLRSGRNIVEFLGGAYSLPVYALVAAVYVVVNVLLSALARALEQRQRRVAGSGARRGVAAGPALADEAA